MLEYLWFLQGISRWDICKLIHYEINFAKLKRVGLPFVFSFVRNGYFFSTFCSSSCQYCSATYRLHPWHETVLVSSFSLRRLKSSFHLSNYFKIRAAKIISFLWFANIISIAVSCQSQSKINELIRFFFFSSVLKASLKKFLTMG